MPFEVKLPKKKKDEKWIVKIREKERVEPPHVTVIRKTKTWRWNLRDQKFMDKEPSPREVSKEVVKVLKKRRARLVKEWDKMYPHNPVGGLK